MSDEAEQPEWCTMISQGPAADIAQKRFQEFTVALWGFVMTFRVFSVIKGAKFILRSEQSSRAVEKSMVTISLLTVIFQLLLCSYPCRVHAHFPWRCLFFGFWLDTSLYSRNFLYTRKMLWIVTSFIFIRAIVNWKNGLGGHRGLFLRQWKAIWLIIWAYGFQTSFVSLTGA